MGLTIRGKEEGVSSWRRIRPLCLGLMCLEYLQSQQRGGEKWGGGKLGNSFPFLLRNEQGGQHTV